MASRLGNKRRDNLSFYAVDSRIIVTASSCSRRGRLTIVVGVFNIDERLNFKELQKTRQIFRN